MPLAGIALPASFALSLCPRGQRQQRCVRSAAHIKSTASQRGVSCFLVRLPYTPWRSDLRPPQAVALGKGPERAEQQNLTLRVEDAEVVR